MTTANRSQSRYWYRPEVGPQPPLILIGTNIGLGPDLATHTWLGAPNGDRYECEGIEPVLRVIDLVQEPDRTKLLAGAALDYGLPIEALMGGLLPPGHDVTGDPAMVALRTPEMLPLEKTSGSYKESTVDAHAEYNNCKVS